MPEVVLWEAALGLALGVLLGLLGYRSRLLTARSAAVLLLALTAVFAVAGWEWGGVLVVHVVAEGLWARCRVPAKMALGQRFSPLERRGVAKVLGRLGWPVILALYQHAGDHALLFSAFVGAVAVATADAWSTEVGVLSAQPPRLITTRRPVEAGTAGGVSTLGIVAALGGAWLIGFVGLALTVLSEWLAMRAWDRTLLWLPLAATLGGLIGDLVDSLLGATAQAVYYCEQCEQQTESYIHTCGQQARRVRGVPWLTNEAVDLVSGLIGAAICALVVGLLAHLQG